MSDAVPFGQVPIGGAFTMDPLRRTVIWVKYDTPVAVRLGDGERMLVALDLHVYPIAVTADPSCDAEPSFDAAPRVLRTVNQSARTNRLLRQLLTSQRAIHRTLRQYLGVEDDG